MTNQELLRQVHIYLNNTNFFYSRVVDTTKKHKLDEIITIKKRLCNISAFHASRYPIQILLIKHDLKKVLPFQQYPAYYEYSNQLTDILNNCRQNIKSSKVTI